MAIIRTRHAVLFYQGAVLQVAGYGNKYLRKDGETRVTPAHIQNAVDGNLERLGVDHIDLLQARPRCAAPTSSSGCCLRWWRAVAAASVPRQACGGRESWWLPNATLFLLSCSSCSIAGSHVGTGLTCATRRPDPLARPLRGRPVRGVLVRRGAGARGRHPVRGAAARAGRRREGRQGAALPRPWSGEGACAAAGPAGTCISVAGSCGPANRERVEAR